MPDEEKNTDVKEEEEQGEGYYDEIRADIETSVTAYATLVEIDLGLHDKSEQKKIDKAKEDCIYIMCKALKILRESYNE